MQKHAMNKDRLYETCHQPSHSQSQCDGVVLKYLLQFWNLAGLSKSVLMELSESLGGTPAVVAVGRRISSVPIIPSLSWPHQVELLGGKVGTFSPNCRLFPPLLSNLSVMVRLFHFRNILNSTNILNDHRTQLK